MVAVNLKGVLGRFHYWKWVYAIRYYHKFGDSYVKMIANGTKERVADYAHRKHVIANASNTSWTAEADAHELNIDELEDAVYRVRCKTVHDDCKLPNGQEISFTAPPVAHIKLTVPAKKTKPEDLAVVVAASKQAKTEAAKELLVNAFGAGFDGRA